MNRTIRSCVCSNFVSCFLVTHITESLELNDASTSLAPTKFLERHENLFSLIQQLREVEKDLNPRLPNRDGKAWKRFFQWIDKHQQLSDKQSVTASDPISSYVGVSECQDNQRGYGLVTKRKVSINQAVCQVPISCMLTIETVNEDKKLTKLVHEDPILSDMPNVVLVMHLLNEFSKGDDSVWFPYLAILPNSHSTIFHLSVEQIRCLRVSNHIYDVVKMIRAITRQYAYFYSKLQATDLPLKNKLTYDFYCWGVSTVCTRQQELPSNKKVFGYPTMNALIPILDMCNHKEGYLPPVYDDERCILRINASVDLKPGDEVFIFYGYRSSGNFFIHNGFVPSVVEKDFLPLILGMNKQEDLFQKRWEICSLLGLTTSGRFRLNNSQELMDAHLVSFLVVLLMYGQELDHVLNCNNPTTAIEVITKQIVEVKKLDQEYEISEKPEEDLDKLNVISIRLKTAISNYISQRAMIYEKVIDKTITSIKGDDQLTQNIVSLLNHEKKILAGFCTH